MVQVDLTTRPINQRSPLATRSCLSLAGSLAADSKDAQAMSTSADFVRLVRDTVSGVEAIRAGFCAHAYDLHRHDDWLVGTTEHGVQEFFCRGKRHRSTPGRVIL